MKQGDLGRLLDDSIDEARVARNWRGTRHKRQGRERSWAWPALAGAMVAAACFALVVWLSPPVEVAAPAERPAPSPQAPTPLAMTTGPMPSVLAVGESHFSDGSRIVVRGRLTTIENAEGVFETELAEGRARFEVAEHTGRRWIVRAGDVRVEVLGTIFVVDRTGAATLVEVERGVVRVTDGADLSRVLRAGESLRIEPTPAPRAEAPLPVALPAPVSRPRVDAPRPAPIAPAPVDPVPSLFAEADAARGAGRYADAVAPLQSIVRDHATHASAPVAAVVLGRIAMDRLHDDALARASFQRAMELGVPAALRAEVEARLARLP